MSHQMRGNKPSVSRTNLFPRGRINRKLPHLLPAGECFSALGPDSAAAHINGAGRAEDSVRAHSFCFIKERLERFKKAHFLSLTKEGFNHARFR
jgi:hypothetical protein